MGEVIQFPGNYRPEGIKGINVALSSEECRILEVAHGVAKDAVHDATIQTGTLEFGPSIGRLMDEPGAWGLVLLEGDQDQGPDLTVV